MLQYITRRLLQFIPVFFGVTLRAVPHHRLSCPGDPIQMRAERRPCPRRSTSSSASSTGSISPGTCSTVNYPRRTACSKGDLGTSITTGRPVSDDPRGDSYPYTIKLALRRDHHRDHRRDRGGHHLGGQAVLVLGRLRHACHVDTRVAAGVLARHDAAVRSSASGSRTRRTGSSTCRSRAHRAAASRTGCT